VARRRKLHPSRFQWFLLVSAVVIAAGVVAAGLVVGWFFEHHILAQEEEHTAKNVLVEAREHLAAADFDLPHTVAPSAAFAVFTADLPGVSRIKMYERMGRIVWSNEPKLIGMAFPDNSYVTSAFKGAVTTVLEAPKRSEHVYEKSKGYGAEAYVPITFPGSPEVVGVIETHKNVTDLVLGIRRTQRLIWGSAAGLASFLYIALAFVVWRASLNEQRAMRRLEAAHERLAARTTELERANLALCDTQALLVVKERLAAVGEVVVGLHHTILNPLAGILGAFQVLKQEGIGRPQQIEALTQAKAELRKIERLVRRLPALRQTAETLYVGDTRMLDLERSGAEEERASQ
jgi:hypothetical protein